jgi:hypothetical protein
MDLPPSIVGDLAMGMLDDDVPLPNTERRFRDNVHGYSKFFTSFSSLLH